MSTLPFPLACCSPCLGGFPAPVHTLLEVLAVLAGARLYATLRARQSDPVPDQRRQVVLVGLFQSASALETLGLLLGLVGVEAAKALVGETRRTGDLFVFPFAVAVGRVGCFLTGVKDSTAGVATSVP